MLISTLNCEMWPNFSYRGVRSVQLLLLLLLLMVFSSENFGFSPPYAGIAGIGPGSIGIKSSILSAIFDVLIIGRITAFLFLLKEFTKSFEET